MVGEPRVAGSVLIEAGMTIELGPDALIEADAEGHAVRLVTTDALVLHGRHICAPIHRGSEVRRMGRLIGRSILEPLAELDDGRIVSLIGQPAMRVDYTDEPLAR